jgi:hypothetical protein
MTMKTCCGNRCNNQFEGPGCLCPGCKQKNEPRLRKVVKFEEVMTGQQLPESPKEEL